MIFTDFFRFSFSSTDVTEYDDTIQNEQIMWFKKIQIGMGG